MHKKSRVFAIKLFSDFLPIKKGDQTCVVAKLIHISYVKGQKYEAVLIAFFSPLTYKKRMNVLIWQFQLYKFYIKNQEKEN